MMGHRETIRHVEQTERMSEPPPDPPAVSYEFPLHSQEPIKASSTLVAEQVPQALSTLLVEWTDSKTAVLLVLTVVLLLLEAGPGS